jgi:hypothetical protein
MLIRSQMDWKKLSEEQPTESQKSYLVAVPYQDNACYMVVAKWYKKGDRILLFNPTLKAQMDANSNTETINEKLLRIILGKDHCVYEVVKDGFYDILPNTEYQHGDAGENGCIECVDELCGNEILWAALPMLPEGFVTDDEQSEREKADYNALRKKQDDELIETIEERLNNDKVLNVGFREYFPDGITSRKEIEATSGCGTKYKIPAIRFAKLMNTARNMLTIIDTMNAQKISAKKLDGIFEKALKERDMVFENILKDSNITDIETRRAFYRLVSFMRDSYDSNPCMRIQYKYMYKNDKSKLVQILTQSYLTNGMIWDLKRLHSFTALSDPPAVIRQTFFYNFAKRYILEACADCIVGVDSILFARTFNVDEKGNFVDGRKIGRENGEDEEFSHEDNVVLEDDEEDEPVLGKDIPFFAVTISPNHLMFQGDWSVLDNTLWNDDSIQLDCLVRDKKGNIKVFKEWSDAKKFADKLTKTYLMSRQI